MSEKSPILSKQTLMPSSYLFKSFNEILPTIVFMKDIPTKCVDDIIYIKDLWFNNHMPVRPYRKALVPQNTSRTDHNNEFRHVQGVWRRWGVCGAADGAKLLNRACNYGKDLRRNAYDVYILHGRVIVMRRKKYSQQAHNVETTSIQS